MLKVKRSVAGGGYEDKTIAVEPDPVTKDAFDEYLQENYSSIVGSLIYITITTRPDLCFAIGKLSRGMHAP